jgi:hypothetical protein
METLTTIELFLIGTESLRVMESRVATACMKAAAESLNKKTQDEIMRRDIGEVTASMRDMVVGAPQAMIDSIESQIRTLRMIDMIKKLAEQ